MYGHTNVAVRTHLFLLTTPYRIFIVTKTNFTDCLVQTNTQLQPCCCGDISAEVMPVGDFVNHFLLLSLLGSE